MHDGVDVVELEKVYSRCALRLPDRWPLRASLCRAYPLREADGVLSRRRCSRRTRRDHGRSGRRNARLASVLMGVSPIMCSVLLLTRPRAVRDSGGRWSANLRRMDWVDCEEHLGAPFRSPAFAGRRCTEAALHTPVALCIDLRRCL